MTGLPDGFAYVADLLDPREEADLARWCGSLDLRPFEYRGYRGLRRVISFGTRYDFAEEAAHPAQPIPEELEPLRVHVAAAFGIASSRLAHALITAYPVGAPIGWHRDRPVFGDVFGVSLLSACRFRLRRRTGATWQRAAVELAPRSAYALRGPARTLWEHSIAPADHLRYSVTFRTLTPGRGVNTESRHCGAIGRG
jgi:alkylated DNA repair dioxygenase AlkB